jgi:hypothetical protein
MNPFKNSPRGLVKLLVFVKIRIYSKSEEELWLHEWKNPLSKQLVIGNPMEFLRSLQRGSGPEGYLFVILILPRANQFIQLLLRQNPNRVYRMAQDDQRL